MIRAIIFDCFGVLLTDSLTAMCRTLPADKQAQVQAQVQVLVEQSTRGVISSEESNRQIAAIFGLSFDAYRARVQSGEIRNEALFAYIRELRQHYKTALLSNVSSGGLQRRFRDDELARHFDAVVASSDVGYAKPEPDIYEIAADRLGVRYDECVFTDDRLEYCQGARSVGMQAIPFESTDQFRRELAPLLG